MIRLRLPANLLQVYELAKLRVDKDVMAPARPPQLEPERLHEPLHVREGHVRDVAAGEPHEEPLRIHDNTLSPTADNGFTPGSRWGVFRGFESRRSRPAK